MKYSSQAILFFLMLIIQAKHFNEQSWYFLIAKSLRQTCELYAHIQ